MESTGGGEADHTTETLVPRVYEELRRLAAYRMKHEAPGQTISGTALVHEAYLRIQAEKDGPRWKSEAEFFGAAAEAMRRILIDRIRAKRRIKRGRNPEKVELNEETAASDPEDGRLMEINEALDDLEAVDRSAAELVKLRFFVGMTLEEMSEATGTPVRSLSRQWAFAKTWLARRLGADEP